MRRRAARSRERGLLPLRLWGLCLGLLTVGCESFREDYSYRGNQRVAEGDFSVSAVFNTEEAPIVMAVRRNDGGQAEMNLLRLTDSGACAAGVFSRYLAAGDHRGYRLSLLDVDQSTWEFFDQDCGSSLRVERADPDGLRVLIDPRRNEHRYVLLDQDRALWALDPFEGTRRLLVDGIAAPRLVIDPSALPPPDGGLSLWVLRDSGLELISAADGAVLHHLTDDVIGFQARGDVSDLAMPLELLLVTRQQGIALIAVFIMDGVVSSALLWEQAGACRAYFEAGLADCADPTCTRSTSAQRLLSALSLVGPLQARREVSKSVADALASRLAVKLPWLGMESPCQSGDLKLRSIVDPEVELRLEGAFENFAVVPGIQPETVALLFMREGEGEAVSHYLPLGGEDETVKVPIEFNAGALLLPDRRGYRVLTRESPPRWIAWSPGEGVRTVLANIAVDDLGITHVRGDLALHDLQDGGGELSRCVGERCRLITAGVHPLGYRVYQTQARIGEDLEAVAFLRDFDQEVRTGELVVAAPAIDTTVVIDTGVRTFREVESGPARGIVYSVHDEARRGLWFAPR